MSDTATGLRVTVAERGVDAALVAGPGRQPVLVLREHMSYGAAVRAVGAVLPQMSPEEVRALVRSHLPHAVDLDDEVERSLRTRPGRPGVQAPVVMRRRDVAALVAVCVTLLASLVGANTIHMHAEVEELRLELTQQAAAEGQPAARSPRLVEGHMIRPRE